MAIEEPHQCHFCGEWVLDGKDPRGDRHFLSDCRPDLVHHGIGETCTWWYGRGDAIPDCYAYQNSDLEWTSDHAHFFEDRPM